MAIILFVGFVAFVLWLSFYLGARTRTSNAYYAAGGQIHWGVNGIAFAGDYLSAASFLGICGMIATVGYDGFLYSIGYLAGWIVALFVVAEAMKRLGKYTFTDALDAKFDSRGIKLAAAISTLIISIFYLIPQMVGAGVLVEPLLGLAHHWGVLIVGAVVITIVATAGMTSTTYVQFIKGGLLIIFSTVLVISVLGRGFTTKPDQGGKVQYYEYASMPAEMSGGQLTVTEPGWDVVEIEEVGVTKTKIARFALLDNGGARTWWELEKKPTGLLLQETQSVIVTPDGQKTINGSPASDGNQLRQIGNVEILRGEKMAPSGRMTPFSFLAGMSDPNTTIRRWQNAKFTDESENAVTVYFPVLTTGNKFMRPGLKFKVEGSPIEKLDFISLMLALFCGTAALPHILIRYYTVPDPASARKSTIVAIAAIGFFYILTLFMGLGAMMNGVVPPADNNMAAPLLARSFTELLFAVISAIAFATILGTVSGLIVAASGAVAHDLADRYMGISMSDQTKVKVGKIAALVVGAFAIVLGIVFKGMNVSFLVGLAFAVAASANLPSIIMLLFWKKTTAKGITASIFTGIVSALVLIALSPDLFKQFGLDPTTAPIPFTNPGIISIPLSFTVLVVVSLMTQKKDEEDAEAEAA